MIIKNFIAIEGIDGSGKSTQSALLSNAFNESGKVALLTTEPTKGPTGLFLREVLEGKIEVDPRTAAYLFAADRCEHIFGAGGVTDLCDEGNIVISDRYLFSSLAYQSLTTGEQLPKLLNDPFPLPEVLIFLKIDSEAALKRIASRSKNNDIYEKKDFQKKLSLVYDRILAQYQKDNSSQMKIIIVDGGLSEEKVFTSITKTLGLNAAYKAL